MFYEEDVINDILEDAEEIEKDYECSSEDIDYDIGVIRRYIYLREEPSKESNPLCILKKDLEVVILRDINEWFHVVTESGIEGYCMQEFVEIE